MTAPIYGDWIAHNATPDSTCPPDAVGKRGQVQLADQTRLKAECELPDTFNGCAWRHIGRQTIIAYRILIEPVRGEIVLSGAMRHEPDGKATFGEEVWPQTDTHTLRLPTLDGALIPGEYIGPDGVITVTEVR